MYADLSIAEVKLTHIYGSEKRSLC